MVMMIRDVWAEMVHLCAEIDANKHDAALERAMRLRDFLQNAEIVFLIATPGPQ